MTRPLSKHAREVLASLGGSGRPSQDINPGVVNKLVSEGLAELYEAPSPYRTKAGTRCTWIRAKAAS